MALLLPPQSQGQTMLDPASSLSVDYELLTGVRWQQKRLAAQAEVDEDQHGQVKRTRGGCAVKTPAKQASFGGLQETGSKQGKAQGRQRTAKEQEPAAAGSLQALLFRCLLRSSSAAQQSQDALLWIASTSRAAAGDDEDEE
jgi:hypothetical protein